MSIHVLVWTCGTFSSYLNYPKQQKVISEFVSCFSTVARWRIVHFLWCGRVSRRNESVRDATLNEEVRSRRTRYEYIIAFYDFVEILRTYLFLPCADSLSFAVSGEFRYHQKARNSSRSDFGEGEARVTGLKQRTQQHAFWWEFVFLHR